jgi:hypothetical protein
VTSKENSTSLPSFQCTCTSPETLYLYVLNESGELCHVGCRLIVQTLVCYHGTGTSIEKFPFSDDHGSINLSIVERSATMA